MHLQLGLLQWGSLQRSPDPLAGGEGFAAPSPTTLSPQPVSLRLWILTIRVLGVHPKTNFWLRFCSQRQLSAKFWKLSGNTPCYCSIHAASHVPQHHSACGSQHFDTVALVRSVFYVHVCCLLTHAFYETNELMKTGCSNVECTASGCVNAVYSSSRWPWPRRSSSREIIYSFSRPSLPTNNDSSSVSQNFILFIHR